MITTEEILEGVRKIIADASVSMEDFVESLSVRQPEKKGGRVEKGERYWHVDGDGCVMSIVECLDRFDDGYYQVGNYFHTKEEAEKELAKRQAIVRVKDWIRENLGEFEPDWEDRSQYKANFYWCFSHKKFIAEIDYCNKSYSPVGHLRGQEDFNSLVKACEADLKIIWGV